jgi:hypothetical protein
MLMLKDNRSTTPRLKREIHSGALTLLTLLAIVSPAAANQASQPQVPPPVQINDLSVHDPCILADTNSRTYYIYAGYDLKRDGGRLKSSNGRAGVKAFLSKDLLKWTGPQLVFEIPAGFWGDADSSPWAPEVHAYNGKYYLFTTFNAWKEEMDRRPGRPFINKRASQILVADSPLGPFKPFSNQPHTPTDEMTLDATFWVEDGQPWLIYCHEWVQLGNGLVKAIRLKPDLSATEGDPITLLNAGGFAWTRKEIGYRAGRFPGAVTDGPYFWRTSRGVLAMIWSSWTPEHQYALAFAYSPSGKLAGPWQHDAGPTLWDDRGHGMIFRDFDGRLLLCLHRYFHQPKTRVQLWELEDVGDRLKLGKQILGAP